ncbi:alpha/beta hydrolase [Streptomyces mutabilis]|uniref:alpha/beta fold hydrolase n=1 Tax=Streptomyces mutabilis TaxID=67332 RepID=UPI0033BB8F83
MTDIDAGARVDVTRTDHVRVTAPGGAEDGLRLSFVDVDGARIAMWSAGDPSEDALVLVHGSRANRAWWAGMVPLLAKDRHVVLVELSGHGRSDHRSRYSWGTWAAEVAAVVRRVGAPATVVGHSLGGVVSAVTAAAYPRLVNHLVVFDAYPRGLGMGERRPRRVHPRRYYRTRAELAARFRLRPAQELPEPELTRRLLDAGMTQTPSGWTWSSDPAVRADWDDPVLDRSVSRIVCPTTWIFSQHTDRLHSEAARRIPEEASAPYVMVSVPGTHHHLILEKPDVCSALLAMTWSSVREEGALPRGAGPQTATPHRG